MFDQINDIDFNKHYLIQIWSFDSIDGTSLKDVAEKVSQEVSFKNSASVEGLIGPTPWLPDFFSELYGSRRSYLVAVKRTADPVELKRTCVCLEYDSDGKRFCDIDVYISEFDKISRKKLNLA